MVHHEPDLSRTPCLGCDELIEPHELQKDSYHQWRSCCSWHPYHWWCIRHATRAIAPMDRCGECGGALTGDEIDDAIRWGATFPRRVHKRAPDEDPRPDSIRLVRWLRRPHVDTGEFPPRAGIPDRLVEELTFVRRWFDIVHDACHEPDDWRTQLRAEPRDNDLRAVYADFLEGAGEVARAEFVRVVLRRRLASGDRIAFLDRQLRDLRAELPGSWCRDVAGDR